SARSQWSTGRSATGAEAAGGAIEKGDVGTSTCGDGAGAEMKNQFRRWAARPSSVTSEEAFERRAIVRVLCIRAGHQEGPWRGQPAARAGRANDCVERPAPARVLVAGVIQRTGVTAPSAPHQRSVRGEVPAIPGDAAGRRR